MKHWIACLSLLTLLLATACDTVNHSQLQVRPPVGKQKTFVTVPASEREAVRAVLEKVAKEWYFEDRTKISLIPDTICSYAQPDAKQPLGVRAWAQKGSIVIDITQKPTEMAGESSAYRRLRDRLVEDLEKAFGDRLGMVGKMRQAQSRVEHVR